MGKFLLNPWFLLAALVSLLVATAGGIKLGSDHQIAKQAATKDLVAEVEERAQSGAAKAIAKNRPIVQYNKSVLEREILKVPDYSRCMHSDDSLRALNAIIEGESTEFPSDLVVPKNNEAGR